MKRLRLDWNRSVASPLMAVAFNILLIYILYTIARVEFLLENYSYFSRSVSEGHLLTILKGGIVIDTPGIFYTNVLYIFMMLIPFHLKERATYYRVCKWVFIIVNSIALIISLCDSVYFPFTLRRTSAEIFGEFSNETNLGKIFLTELVSHWYLVVLAAILIYGLWKLYVSPNMDISRQSKPRYYIVGICCLAIAALTCIGGIRGGFVNRWYNYLAALPLAYLAYRLWKLRNKGAKWKGAMWLCAIASAALLITAPVGGWRHRDIRPISVSSAALYAEHPVESALVLNTPFSIIRTIGKTIFSDPKYFTDAKSLDAVYSPVHLPTDSVKSGKKNVVIIIIESFGREYIGGFNKEVLGPGYKGYTPFTDSLINVSATWLHSYANGRKSIDGMPSILAGIPMFIKPFILTPQSLNKTEGIPAHLKKAGYQTAFFHGARTGSMGFNSFAKSIGFDNYYGREDFNKDPRYRGDEDFDGYWAIWDEPFLQYYATKMTEMKQPFATALFTASSHHPFHIPEQYKNKFKEEELPIHKCIRYTDNALRRFFDTARKQPWYANTIFVVTSDHTNMSNHDEYKSDIGAFCAPVIIFDPSGEIQPGMRPGIAQQTDIMPTVLNHIGYDKPYVAFGIDLLSTADKDTWAVNYLNGIYQYVKQGFVLQFDGNKSTGLYSLSDAVMKNNLIGKPEYSATIAGMEKEVKGIIQSYMQRMISDKLSETK